MSRNVDYGTDVIKKGLCLMLVTLLNSHLFGHYYIILFISINRDEEVLLLSVVGVGTL